MNKSVKNFWGINEAFLQSKFEVEKDQEFNPSSYENHGSVRNKPQPKQYYY